MRWKAGPNRLTANCVARAKHCAALFFSPSKEPPSCLIPQTVSRDEAAKRGRYWRLRTHQGGCSSGPHKVSPKSGMVSSSLFRQSPAGELAQAPGGKPAADAVQPSEGKVSPFARCARQACPFSFLGEDAMLEALGIVLVALAILAFLVVIGRSF